IKNLKSMTRDRAQLLWLFGYPLIFVLLYRFAFEEGVFELMAPGVLIAGPTILIMQLSTHFAEEKEYGTLQRLVTTPASRSTILVSGLLSQLVVGAIQIVIFVIIELLLGAPVQNNAHITLLFFIPFLMTFTSLGFGLLLASVVKDPSSAGGIAWFIILPLQFLGGVVTNPPFLPFLPTALAVDSLKSVMVAGILTFEAVGLRLIYILIWGVVVSLLGMLLFQRKTAIL
ncbi:MAG: ABC transporter permease, partial [Candidatus Hodarchaeales archaeon]